MSAANPVTLPLKGYAARHVRLAVDGKVATITLARPEKPTPSPSRSTRSCEISSVLREREPVRAVVLTGGRGNSAPAATCTKSSAR